MGKKISPTKSEYIEIKKSKVDNRKGAFAKKDIPKGTRVIEYVGDKVTKKESDKRSDITFAKAKKDPNHGDFYIYEINKKYNIDGDVPWNTARFINHSCNPNCESDIIKSRVFIISIKDIKKGEELNYDYGIDLAVYEDYPCKCGSKNCIGYITSKYNWPELKKILKKKKKLKKQKKLLIKQLKNIQNL